MLTPNQHDAEAELPPELSKSLETLCFAVAVQLASGGVRSNELNARFGAMQPVFTRTIRAVSRDWNRSNTLWRVLPVELQAMCWSYLPQRDRVRLALVCSSWRHLSRGIPALWTSIDVTGSLHGLDILFARSGKLPFDASVLVCSVQEHAYVDDCLRKHANRLRALRISDRDVSFAGNTRGQGLFRYPAPLLQHFSLKRMGQTNDGNFALAPDIFAGSAPHLRSLILHEILFPATCPAFKYLTSLEIRWSLDLHASGLQHIFTVSPDVEHLVLSNFRDVMGMPVVPTSSKLRKVELTTERALIDVLHADGYLGVPQLEITTNSWWTMREVAMYPSLTVPLSLSFASSRQGEGVGKLRYSIRVILRGDRGAKIKITETDGLHRTPQSILRDAPNFSAVQRLVLPTAARHTNPTPAGGVQYPYLEGDLRLPALRTLALAHGAYGTVSIFDPGLLNGVLIAPSLSRVEIVRAGAGALAKYRAPVPAIAPGSLALFIDGHIVCDEPALLALAVSPENADLLDFADEDGMESLRGCVGTLVHD